MSLERLASELDETARQTAEMVDKINVGLSILMDEKHDNVAARTLATQKIIMALQMQDRIQQRCENMALATRRMDEVMNEQLSKGKECIWSQLSLDELRKPELSGIAGRRAEHDDIELF